VHVVVLCELGSVQGDGAHGVEAFEPQNPVWQAVGRLPFERALVAPRGGIDPLAAELVHSIEGVADHAFAHEIDVHVAWHDGGQPLAAFLARGLDELPVGVR